MNLLRKTHFGHIHRSFSLNRTTIRLKRTENLPQNGFPSLRSPKSNRLLDNTDIQCILIFSGYLTEQDMTLQTRQERKKTEMQLHLMQSAMSLFRVQGFKRTTMGEIAEAADVTKRTLYHHYPMKEALVSAYWLNNVHLNQNQLSLLFKNYPDTRNRLIAVFLSAADGFKSETEFARIHFGYQFQKMGKSAKPHIPSEFTHFLAAIIETGQQENDLRVDIEAIELATQIMLNFTAICLLWFSDTNSFSLDEKLTNAVTCFIDGAGKT